MNPQDLNAVVSSLSKVVELARSLLSGRHEHRQEQEQQVKKALDALYQASRATRLYIASLRDDAAVSHESQPNLADLWYQASQEVYLLDRDTSDLLFLKSQYWLDPAKWNRDVDIELDRICDITRAALQ